MACNECAIGNGDSLSKVCLNAGDHVMIIDFHVAFCFYCIDPNSGFH